MRRCRNVFDRYGLSRSLVDEDGPDWIVAPTWASRMENQQVVPGILERNIAAVGDGAVQMHRVKSFGSGAGVTRPFNAQRHLGVIDALVYCSVEHGKRGVVGPWWWPVVHPGLKMGLRVIGHLCTFDDVVDKSKAVDGRRLTVNRLGLAGTERQRDGGNQQERSCPVAHVMDVRHPPVRPRWTALSLYRRMTHIRLTIITAFRSPTVGYLSPLLSIVQTVDRFVEHPQAAGSDRRSSAEGSTPGAFAVTIADLLQEAMPE